MIKVTYIDHMGNDLRISNAARVSFKKKREEFLFEGDPRLRPTGRSDEQLIKDLAAEGHISPFGHCFATFKIVSPIFVARQLVKHKFLRWSEVSRRYVDDEPEFYVPDVWRGRSADKKQGSDGTVEFEDHYEEEMSLAKSYYDYLLDWGVAPEQARMVLPQSTMTEWWWSGSLDAFAAMCNLRCKDDTQYETRLVANQISEEMAKLFPVSWKALMENDNG
jgi:thymidylate synthase (FAD)